MILYLVVTYLDLSQLDWDFNTGGIFNSGASSDIDPGFSPPPGFEPILLKLILVLIVCDSIGTDLLEIVVAKLKLLIAVIVYLPANDRSAWPTLILSREITFL